MATYKQVQDWIMATYGFRAKTCWIAHVKAENGKTKRVAANRINMQARKHPCPADKRIAVETALRHFEVI
ncbi:hypothetical protein [Rhizobium sp. PAMB 3182]